MRAEEYVAARGDTYRSIARASGVGCRELIMANPQRLASEPLRAGELLYLPVPTAQKRMYVVQPGDTLADIAEAFACAASRLRELNPGLSGGAEPVAGARIELPPPSPARIVIPSSGYGPARLAADVKRLTNAFPFLKTATIGKSVMGKPIVALRIGDGPFCWHLNAAVHANEWITSLIAMRFLEDYGRACRRRARIGGLEAADLYRRTSLWVVPMVNPDGVELVQEGLQPGHPLSAQLGRWNRGSPSFRNWKANARGVDLNDQFPAGWEEERRRRGVPGPAPRDYGGDAPLCEPEAAALASFAEEQDFDAVISLHTQGEEIYWNYGGLEPPESKAWASRLGLASGYRPVELSGSDAGFKDWFIARFRKPGFTVEAGHGRNPLPLAAFEDMYDDCLRLLTEALDLSPGGLYNRT
ncbi:M14 family metallopeptidase [Cohnella sp. JJ-181]|uniref:M14 family metallopeptidase n=1 Tax=Cohnella rhizoplanae TaxID=2974897 RepID=UPI0022FF4F4A|nr:M14 family metallopeptidase [Cohnella sp. JJ-181]CAI6014766.1 Gamma-D-glutamyl-L-diamino acid endopeptidase 1 [Cohnella sp. JJ-181]